MAEQRHALEADGESDGAPGVVDWPLTVQGLAGDVDEGLERLAILPQTLETVRRVTGGGPNRVGLHDTEN